MSTDAEGYAKSVYEMYSDMNKEMEVHSKDISEANQ